MNTIIGKFGTSSKFKDLVNKIEEKNGPIAISGLTGVGSLQLLSGINEFTKKPILILTYNEIQAKRMLEDIKYFSDKVTFFPKKEVVTYDYVAESKELPYERIESLNQIISKKNYIIVTTIEAAMQKLPNKKILYKNSMEFKVGDIKNLEEIKQKLINLGYTRYELIDGRGQFSIRGGILDISITTEIGVRIEFWGDEIDSIRTFNIATQRSIKTLEKVKINPAHEYVLEENKEKIINNIKQNIYEESQEKIVEEDIEQIQEGDYISKVDKYFDSFYSEPQTILEYLSNNCIIALDEITKIKQRAKNISNDNNELIKSLLEKNKIVPDAIKNMYSYEQIEEKLKGNQIIYVEKQDDKVDYQAEKYNFVYREINYYKSEIEELIKDLKKWLNNKKEIVVLADNKEKLKKLKNIFEKEEIVSKIEENLNQTIIAKSEESIVTISPGKLSSGFENFELNQIVISADDLIDGGKKKRLPVNTAYKEGQKVVFADLKIGDYVVHKIHGIGIYIGVNTIKADGVIKDYIKIKYKNDDILYVPTDALDAIRKYIGGDGTAPKINKLGSKEWQNTKAKVKKNLREVAKELIELYAKREKSKGFAFSKDTPWQNQFEASFPYQETDDQLRCIEEIKKDMENNKPMDRLLCGDVGYGKTEVAIRAAFKAVDNGKQVAYLVPTTILAQQHYNTFAQRFHDYPITVRMMSRFCTAKEQKETIEGLKNGTVDVVIGTHRLLSKDMQYKNLGLLVIDEEQRFGVTHKEKIKTMKKDVDVLSLSATPIPRTLHMSLIGIRDMSVLEEPPHDRRAIQTYVMEYNEELVKEAVYREMTRGGQVYYVYNKVRDIDEVTSRIQELVPEANVAFAHGQMRENQLEDIMYRFINGDIDVLVSTTIIETGLDISNVNTMIIHDADNMGLSQLYQLRGRVGRSNRTAYAFLMYRRNKMLKEVAEKRLAAIREYSDLGSGFKIAMRDLEIRGAGNLLGAEQSGHMEAVGYDLYCKMLHEAVKEARGEAPAEQFETSVDIRTDAFIPSTYIANESQKLDMYKRIAGIETDEEAEEMLEELIDRFGEPPKSVQNLLTIARLKAVAHSVYIKEIVQREDLLKILMYEKAKIHAEHIPGLVKAFAPSLKFAADPKGPYFTYRLGANSREKNREILEVLRQLLEQMHVFLCAEP